MLKPASQAKPGDLLQYKAVYTNKGDSAAGHLLANLPIPAGTTLQANGIDPAGPQASVDSRQFAPMPLMHDVVGKDGKSHHEPVPMSDIRALRWDLGTLAPQQSRSVQARVEVNSQSSAQPAASSASPAKH